MSKTRDIIDLIDRGYRPYDGYVPDSYYDKSRCKKRKQARWFTRPWSEEHKQTRFYCTGCYKGCVAVDPVGWQLLLPFSQTRPGRTVFVPMQSITVDELLKVKKVLRVDEAAWALNVSRNTVANMIDEGTLDVVPGTPTRVTSDSVQKNLQPV